MKTMKTVESRVLQILQDCPETRKEGLTESLKAADMMSWVRKMNNLKSRVQEIVMKELIHFGGS